MGKFGHWIKSNRTDIAVFTAVALMIALCCIGIRYEKPWIAYSVFVFIGIYLICFHTEKCLYLLAFLTPLSVDVREKIPDVAFNISLPSEIILICLTFIFIWKTIQEKRYPKAIFTHPISIAIYAYLAWIFIATLFSSMPLVSFKFLFSKLWFIIPCYFFLAESIYKDERNAIKFLFCYALGLGIVVCMTTIKHIQMGAIEKVAYWVMSPYYNDHTAYGAILAFFIAILTGIALRKEENKRIRSIAFVLLFICILGFYLSYSRAAWLSLVLAIGVYFLMRWRIRFRTVFIVSAVLLFSAITFADDIMYKLNKNDTESSQNLVEHLQSMSNITSDASNVERINRWTSAIAMFKEKPFLGWGPGTYQFQYAPFQRSKYKTIITTNSGDGGNAHSEYLGLLAETGFMGTFFLLVLIASALSSGMKTYHHDNNSFRQRMCCICTIALVSYFIHGFFNNFLDTEKLAVPVFGAMAVIAALDAKRKETKP